MLKSAAKFWTYKYVSTEEGVNKVFSVDNTFSDFHFE